MKEPEKEIGGLNSLYAVEHEGNDGLKEICAVERSTSALTQVLQRQFDQEIRLSHEDGENRQEVRECGQGQQALPNQTEWIFHQKLEDDIVCGVRMQVKCGNH